MLFILLLAMTSLYTGLPFQGVIICRPTTRDQSNFNRSRQGKKQRQKDSAPGQITRSSQPIASATSKEWSGPTHHRLFTAFKACLTNSISLFTVCTGKRGPQNILLPRDPALGPRLTNTSTWAIPLSTWPAPAVVLRHSFNLTKSGPLQS